MAKLTDILGPEKMEQLKQEPFEVQQGVLKKYSPELFNESPEVIAGVMKKYGLKTSEGFGAKAKRIVGQYAEPVLGAAGAATGAALALPVNLIAPGVAEVAGGTLGYLAGKEAARGIKQVMGIERPTTLTQEAGITARTVPEAGIQAAAGPLLGGTMQAGAKTALAEKGLIGRGIEKLGEGARGLLGVTTATGEHGAAIGEAFKTTPGFKEAMRGRTSGDAIVDNARDALRTIRDKRAADYVEKYEKLNPNAQVDIAPLEKRFEQFRAERGIETDESGRMLLKTSGISKEGQKELHEADNLINEFLREHGVLNAETGETTLPFKYADLLKRALADLKPKSNEAKRIIAGIHDTVRGELNKLPHYQAMTKNYAKASGVIEDIEKSLSISGKRTDDQILRRLMQAMREDTTLKRDLMQQLSETGDQQIVGQVAGLMMKEAVKKGGLPLAGIEAATALISGHPWLLLAMAGSSPRLVGETAYMMGLGSKALKGTRLSGAAYREFGMEIQNALKQIGESNVLPGALTKTQSDVVSQPTVEQRQDGGPVMADKPYLVGEKGPEVIVPKTDGTVIPNQKGFLGKPLPKDSPDFSTHAKVLEYLKTHKAAQEAMENVAIGSTGWLKGMPTSKVIEGIHDYLKAPFIEQSLSNVGKAARTVFTNALNQVMKMTEGSPHMTPEQYKQASEFLNKVKVKYGQLLTADPLMKSIISDAEESIAQSVKSAGKGTAAKVAQKAEKTFELDRKKGETLKQWAERLREAAEKKVTPVAEEPDIWKEFRE